MSCKSLKRSEVMQYLTQGFYLIFSLPLFRDNYLDVLKEIFPKDIEMPMQLPDKVIYRVIICMKLEEVHVFLGHKQAWRMPGVIQAK